MAQLQVDPAVPGLEPGIGDPVPAASARPASAESSAKSRALTRTATRLSRRSPRIWRAITWATKRE
jgi:hypothetical protein